MPGKKRPLTEEIINFSVPRTVFLSTTLGEQGIDWYQGCRTVNFIILEWSILMLIITVNTYVALQPISG
jgi:hypothetical protein